MAKFEQDALNTLMGAVVMHIMEQNYNMFTVYLARMLLML
jgi:hypothetical protein